MRSFIALALCLSIVAAPAVACPQKVIVREAVIVKKQAVIVPVYYPLYSVSYQPPADSADTLKLREENLKLREELLRRKEADLKASQGTPATFEALVASRCASCHSAADAKQKGASFVLIEADGKIPPLSVVEKRAILRAVHNGSMPKGGAELTDAEVKLIEEKFGN
jgi:mono/diheme cytochrome c family protein